MIDVLYILGDGSLWDNRELRYSLRSLQRFAEGIGRVFVVGEDPGYLSDAVEFRPVAEADGPKEYRIAAKILWAFENTDISDTVFFMNDDLVLWKPIQVSTYPNYWKGNLKSREHQDPVYQHAIDETCKVLAAHGYETKNYDTHKPILYEREKFLGLGEWWERSRKSLGGFVVKSIYGNVLKIDPGPREKDFKLDKGFPRGEKLRDKIGERDCWSYGDGARCALADFLGREFPERSVYERA